MPCGPRDRTRSDADRAPLPLEGLAGEGLLQEGHDLVHDLLAVREFLSEGRELGLDVAGGDDRDHAAVGDHVEHRDVLGQAQRVVERDDQGREQDAQPLRARGDRTAEHHGRRRVAIR